MNLQKAIAFINSKGNLIEKVRLSSILWSEPPSSEVIKEIGKLQNPNGGFAYWCPLVSNICDTAYILEWLDDLQSHHCDISDKACRFLIDRQREDGGWDEVDDVGNYPAPEWMMPGRLETRTWLTGFCSHVLIRFGYAETLETRCPSDFLLSKCDASGRIRGYLRATWISLPILALHPGPQSQAYHNAIAVVEDNYSEGWTGALIAWMLRCLKDAHFLIDRPLVKRAIANLESKQRQDGSWEQEVGEDENQAVNATISALRSLNLYGRI